MKSSSLELKNLLLKTCLKMKVKEIIIFILICIVEEKLEEYWREILEGYSHILKKIDLILETASASQA